MISLNDRLENGGSRLVRLGRVIGAHGIKGAVKVSSDAGEPQNFSRYDEILLERDSDPGTRSIRRIHSCRVQKNTAILQLEGVDERTGAEALIGSLVLVPRSALGEPAPGQYYLYDLLNKTVVIQQGRAIGRITGFLEGAGQDLLVVQGDREYLIPLVTHFVTSIREDCVEMDLPPGLLEI